jgi:hypothetical protein
MHMDINKMIVYIIILIFKGCEPVLLGNEIWNNMLDEVATELDKLIKEGKTEYEFSAGESKFKIDLIKMVQITTKAKDPNANTGIY